MKSSVTSTPSLRYFDVSWLSGLDGPGLRTVIYLQGCNLRCPWCHSPHSQPAKSPLLFFPTRCQGSGNCQDACPQKVHKVEKGHHDIRRELCVNCGACLDACPVSSRGRLSGALALPTRDASVSEVWTLLRPQLELLRGIGGLTVSGGEPMLQSQDLLPLLQLCQEAGIHTAVETSGALPRRNFERVAEMVDCWLFGLRPTPVYVPPGADLIEGNLAFVAATQARVIVRLPVIADVTDLPDSLERIVAVMRSCNLCEIQLLPFHLGTSHYYSALGRSCSLDNRARPSAARLSTIVDYFREHGLEPRIIG